MRILDLEIPRHDWQAMTCGCNRSAAHVPEDFLAALDGPLPGRIGEGRADNHVYIQSNLMEPAYATAVMLVARPRRPAGAARLAIAHPDLRPGRLDLDALQE